MYLTEKSYEQETNALLVCGSHFKITKYATNAFCNQGEYLYVSNRFRMCRYV